MAQRTIEKIDKTILNNFYKLVHSEAHVRLTAATSTIKILNVFSKGPPDQFNENLNYCIERLVAGLSSNRACARQGYAALLLEILSHHKVSTDKLMNLAQQKYGHITKDATRDNLLAYFLIISIILQSENYKAYTKSLDKIYKQLIQLIYTKSYFDFSVSKLFIQYRELFYSCMLDDIPQHAFQADAKLTTTQLLIIILCHQTKPIKALTSLDRSGLQYLYSFLVNEKFQKQPLHPIFVEFSSVIVTNFPDQFEPFYNTVILAQFFRPNHNELASMGLEYTINLIKTCKSVDIINHVFNEHVIRLLILSLRNRTSLSKHCSEFFNSLKSIFEETSKLAKDSQSQVHFLQYMIIHRLTSPPGSLAFDDDSKSKSISTLLQQATPNVLKKHFDRLTTSLYKQGKKDTELIQISIARQIAIIINRPQMAEDQSTLSKAAKYLLMNSMFSVDLKKLNSVGKKEDDFWEVQGIPKPSGTFKDTVRSALRSAYHSCMEHLVSVCNITQRNQQLNDLIEFSSKLLTSKYMHHANEAHHDSKESDKENVGELWSMYMSSLAKHRALIKKTGDFKLLHPITSLFLFYGLQVVEHGLDCKSQLDELAQSSEEALKDDPNNGSWADILTDQIIAILSATECSPWIRKLCESIFGSLLPHISQTSIDVLCEALLEENHGDCDNTDGEDGTDSGDDSSYADSSDEDDPNESGEPEMEQDGEVESGLDSDGDIEMRAEEGSDESEEMDLCESSNQVSGNSSDGENHEDEESEEEYMTDEQMMKLDPVLADMFKMNRIGNKGGGSSAFKLRCLDLVKKIVMKKANDSETINTILDAILPLAKASKRSPETRPICDKIHQILKKMPGKAKYPKVLEFLASKTINN